MITNYNDKAEFKDICQQIGVSVITRNSFRMQTEDTNNESEMARIINGYLATSRQK